MLLTTQYLEEADRLAQRVAVVDHGKVISEGTPTELKANLGATVLEVPGSPDGPRPGAQRRSDHSVRCSAGITGHEPHVVGSDRSS